MTGPGSPTPTRITLVRHGESNVTVERVVGGRRTCSGLSDLGRRQCRRLARRLDETAELRPDVLLSSDFARAVETAEIIRPSLGDAVASAPIERWREFGEHDPGPDIDGMSFDDYVDRYGTPDWSGDPDADVFPGGETVAEFHARVVSGLDRLEQRFAGRHVVVACHGGVVDAVFRHVLRIDVTGGFDLFTLNASLTDFVGPIEGRDRWRLGRYNDATHLAGLPDATPRRVVG